MKPKPTTRNDDTRSLAFELSQNRQSTFTKRRRGHGPSSGLRNTTNKIRFWHDPKQLIVDETWPQSLPGPDAAKIDRAYERFFRGL